MLEPTIGFDVALSDLLLECEGKYYLKDYDDEMDDKPAVTVRPENVSKRAYH